MAPDGFVGLSGVSWFGATHTVVFVARKPSPGLRVQRTPATPPEQPDYLVRDRGAISNRRRTGGCEPPHAAPAGARTLPCPHGRPCAPRGADASGAGQVRRRALRLGPPRGGGGGLPARRGAHAVDDALARRLPALRRARSRGAVHRRRRPGVRRPVPRRHRRDDRARAPPGRRGRAPARARRADHDAAEPGRGLGRGRAGPPVRPPPLADGDDRDRRQPLRAALRPPPHRPPEDLRDGLVLPRHRRRDAGRARRGPGGAPARGARPAGRRRPDHEGGPLQRRRGPGARPGPRGRGRGADGAGADQHRHRAARRGLPRGGPRRDPAHRHAARGRRDAHALRGARWLHPRVAPGPGHAGGGQADRRGCPGRGVRGQPGAGRPPRAADARARDRRRRGRRNADRQRPRDGRGARDALLGPARGGLRGGGAAGRGVGGRRRRA